MAITSENPIGTPRRAGPILLLSQYREDEYFLREVLTNFACPLETSRKLARGETGDSLPRS